MTHRRKPLGLAALGTLAFVIGAAAPGTSAQSDHKSPPSRYWHRCRSYIVNGGAHLSGYTYVSLDRYGNAPATQHFVRVRNMNVLGWVGDVTVDHYEHPRMWLAPGMSHWVPSPVLILPAHRRRVAYGVDIDPISDATTLAVEVWGARCRR